ncbi:sugar nucleotide-binding protein [Actinoplanes sp. NPDC051411]|uniref:sugar nucleotide-binding protein n=1 Tax=Actinoplanes sp. NPDC051411 TaxID=3155522 RepID=UPI003419E1E7
MSTVLITGVTGHLGTSVAARAAAAGWVVTGSRFRSAGPGAERLDIRDRAAVHDLVSRVRPDVVIHTAAARDDWRTIADGTAHVALAAAAVGARLVHVSTDAVFSGGQVHYDESALPDPIYRYGAAKAAAETAVAAIDPLAALIRTSLILGHGTGQHERLVHDLASGRAQGALFTDMVRMPVHVDDLAGALLEVAATPYAGVLNVAGPEAVSRYDLGLLVAARDGLDPQSLPSSTIAGSGLNLARDVRLNCDRARSLLTVRLRGAREFLAGKTA